MKNILILITLLAVFGACRQRESAAQKQLKEEIATLEKKLLETQDAAKDKPSALLLIETTMQYAKEYPQDQATPDLLFKAGDVAKGAREYGKAVQLWGQVWRNYETHPKAPMALFLQGFTFDSDLGDPKMAKKYYRQFLEKYPGDPLAEKVKELLAVVDVKPEDLIRKFETQ